MPNEVVDDDDLDIVDAVLPGAAAGVATAGPTNAFDVRDNNDSPISRATTMITWRGSVPNFIVVIK